MSIDNEGGPRNRPTTLERAYELAKSGACLSTADISRNLAKEGYDHSIMQMHGPVLVRQLGALCRAAQMTAVRTPPSAKKTTEASA
jgi:hypothetical protein